jgi:hypothetical protein
MMLLNQSLIESSGVAPLYPYTFPILSKNGSGTPSDWTVAIGPALALKTDDGLAGQNYWHMQTASKGRYYQSFAMPATSYSDIDKGNTTIDLSHTIISLFPGEADGVAALVEFFDSGMSFLGRDFTANQYPATQTVDSKTGIIVPPGARTITIGWQGFRKTGSFLNTYFKDIAATLKLGTGNVSSVMLWAEADASMTGWTTSIGNPNVLRGSVDTYYGRSAERWFYVGGTAAYSRCYRSFAIPSGWASKISAGKVKALVRASLFNWTGDDDPSIGIEFVRPGGNTSQKTGDVPQGPNLVSAKIDVAVPVDTTGFILDMEFFRDVGIDNDACVSQPSVLLYEVP